MKEVKWCCPAFKNSYEDHNSRGDSVIVYEDYNGAVVFAFQFRALDRDKLHLHPESKVPLTLMTERTIRFCPSCGKKLRRWYKKYGNQLCLKNCSMSEMAKYPFSLNS